MSHTLSDNTRGILCLMGSLVFLTVSDSIVKWLSPRYALHEIMLFRGCFAMVLVMLFVRYEGGVQVLKTRRPWLHLLRGILLVFANMFFFLGLATMPLAETVALFFMAPVFICLLAKPVLGETVGPARWAAVVIGLIGVVVMMQPGSDVFRLSSLLPVMAALTYSGMQMVTRKLGIRERAATMTFYIQVAFIGVGLLMGLAIGDGSLNRFDNPTLDFLLRAWAMPSRWDLVLLALCGFIVACGGYLISQAYRIAQASVVAPFEYTSLPFALVIGFIVWGDWPSLVSFMGSALIVVSGLIIAFHENRTLRVLPTNR